MSVEAPPLAPTEASAGPPTPGRDDPGSDAWFEEAVRGHYRLVFAVAHQVLGSAADAEDAAQEAFLRAYRARAALAGGREGLEAWLIRIARNAALDIGRKKGRDKALRAHEAARARDPGGPPDLDSHERLRAAIASLPEADAVVVTLRFVEGLSAPEIAGRIGDSAGAVRVRLHRALKRLRLVVDEEECR